MASLVPPGGKKDYFSELRLNREARKAERDGTLGDSSTPVEAAIHITTISGPEAQMLSINPKKRKEEHGKDWGKASRCHGDRSPERSPKQGRGVGGSSSDPDFLGHDLRVAEKVSIKLNPYRQDAYLSACPSQVHDAFMELCSRTLVLGKRMASDLMKRDKNVTALFCVDLIGLPVPLINQITSYFSFQYCLYSFFLFLFGWCMYTYVLSAGIHLGEFFLGREVFFETLLAKKFFIALSAGIHLGEFFLGREVFLETLLAKRFFYRTLGRDSLG